MNYTSSTRLFKIFAVTEKVDFQIDVDAFNAFDIQGYPNPNTTDDKQDFLNSYWPR
jgi:hypothetical protein